MVDCLSFLSYSSIISLGFIAPRVGDGIDSGWSDFCNQPEYTIIISPGSVTS